MDKFFNSSPPLNFYSPPPLNSSFLWTPTSVLIIDRCKDSPFNIPDTIAFFVATLLFLLPLYVRVLHLTNVWRARPVAAATNSDIFTVHMIVMELIVAMSVALFLIGHFQDVPSLMVIGTVVYALSTPSRPLFHCCTCVERYLAVVHPIKYLGLKRGGARMWHVASGCVWFLCFGWVGLFVLYLPEQANNLTFVVYLFSFLIISFCSLSILRSLIRPKPGEVGGDRERVDQSKRRALWTVMAILGVLTLNLSVFSILGFLETWKALETDNLCLVFIIGEWFTLPSSAVQPLLFLYRINQLPGCWRSEG